jgi:DNA-binding beta-propeller fold protein YncE
MLLSAQLVRVAVVGLVTAAAAGPGYHLVSKVVLGGSGGWDYVSFDSASGRLFVTHGSHVDVIDASSGGTVGAIVHTDGVHGVAIADALGRGFTSNGRTASVTVFDLRTLATIGTVTGTGADPDAIVYDPATQRVFTFDADSNTATAIDARVGVVVGKVRLGESPGYAAVDGSGHAYVNLEHADSMAEIDTRSLTVTRRWSLAPCHSAAALAIDVQHRLLFSGCHNKTMAISDIAKGAVVGTAAIGEGVDAVAFDPATETALSANSDGTLTVVHEDSPEGFRVVESVTTQPGVRTLAVDPKSHRVYLIGAEITPAGAPTPTNPNPRPTLVPGSFSVLVFAP